MRLFMVIALAFGALYPSFGSSSNIIDAVASAEVPAGVGAVTVPLNMAAIQKLNYCQERGISCWLGVKSTDEQSKLLWFYDPIEVYVNGLLRLSPIVTGYTGFPFPGVDKHRLTNSWGYEPNHWNYLASGHDSDYSNAWEPGFVTRGLQQYSLPIGGLPISSAYVRVPASVAMYSSPGVTYHFVIFAEDFTFTWQEYPRNSDFPVPNFTATPAYNDSDKAKRVFQAMDTGYQLGSPPWYMNKETKPKHGDPVDLSSGEEEHSPEPDISAITPTGIAVTFSRTYATTIAKAGSCSPGLSAGWTHQYDYYIQGPSISGCWDELTLYPPSGGRETLTPEIDVDFQPTGEFLRQSGASHIVTGIPDLVAGTWQSITLLFPQGISWTFTPGSGENLYVLSSIRDVLGNSFTLVWDEARRLAAIKSANGLSTVLSMSYDANGLLSTISDNTGRKVAYSFQAPAGQFAAHRLTTVSQIVATGETEPPMRWRYIYEAYDGMPLLCSLAQPSPTGTGESSLTLEYSNGKVTAQIDPDGNRTTYTYNTGNTVVTLHDPQENVVQTFTQHFDLIGRNTGVTNALGQRMTIDYEDSRNPFSPTRVTGADGKMAQTTYDDMGNVRTATSARGIVTELTYSYSQSPFGRITQVTENGVVQASYTYLASSGFIKTSQTLRPGSTAVNIAYDTSVMTYDFEEEPESNHGCLVATDEPGDSRTPRRTTNVTYNYTDDLDYDANGDPGTMHLMAYRGLPLTITDKLGRTAHLRYDARGNVTTTIEPNGSRTDYVYNIANQVTETILPELTPGAGRMRVVNEYRFPGGAAWRTKLLAPDGTVKRTATVTYNHGGKVLANTSGDAEDGSCAYDAVGRLTRLTDVAGRDTCYTYDNVGRLTQVSYPSGRTVQSLRFDEAGRVLETVDGNGLHTTYAYNDPSGKVTDIDYANTPGPAADVHYRYDRVGNLIEVADSTGMRQFTYDLLGNSLNVTTRYNGLSALTQSYKYNPDGSIATMQTPMGAYSYAYDAEGRPETLTNPSRKSSKWQYDAQGRLTRQTLGNHAWMSYSYDAQDQLTRRAAYNPKGKLLADYGTFTYDDLGRLTGISGTLPGLPTMSGNQSFVYDDQDRLLATTWTEARGTGETQQFSYDQLNNITTFPHELPGFEGLERAHDAANRWIGYKDAQDNIVGTQLFAYDSNGNPTTWKGNHLAFDQEDHLTVYRDAGNVLRMEAGYRSDGLRAWKESDGKRTYFLYDGTLLLAEIDVTGEVTSFNTWGPTGMLARTTPTRETWYIHDPTGNVALRLDATGHVRSSDRYDSYGSLVSGGDSTDPYGYKGQDGYYTDLETGLILCTWRYYDPLAGRWLTEDPIGYAGGMNTYGYCGGLPLASDPLGLVSGFDDLGVVIAGAAVSVGITLVTDLIFQRPIDWKRLVSSAVAGGVAAWVGMYSGGTLTGAIYGAIDDAVYQFLNILTRGQCDFDAQSFVGSAAMGALFGKIAEKVGPKIVGILKKSRFRMPKAVVEPQCFIAETLIATPEGGRAIETIHKGDIVWSCDLTTSRSDMKTIEQSSEIQCIELVNPLPVLPVSKNRHANGEICNLASYLLQFSQMSFCAGLKNINNAMRCIGCLALFLPQAILPTTFSHDISVELFAPTNAAWAYALLNDVKPGGEFTYQHHLYRVTNNGALEMVQGVDVSKLPDADRAFDKANHRFPEAADVVMVLDQEMKFTHHVVLGTLHPGIRVCFQGRVYDLRAGSTAGTMDIADTGIVSCRVEETYVREAPRRIDLLILDAQGNISMISGTPEHPFYVPAKNEYVEMGKLTLGTVLKTDKGQEATVTASKTRHGEMTVYNLKVAYAHNYYVSSPDGGPKVLVHNANYEPCETLFRGGKWIVRPRDVVLDYNGLVQPGRGPSLNFDPNKVSSFGTPRKIISIPNELEYGPVGSPGHYEIWPKQPMTPERFVELLNQVVTEP